VSAEPIADEFVADVSITANGSRWLTGAEQSVWRDFLDVTRLLMDRLNRQLVEDAGMTLAEYEVLVQVSEAPDRRLRMSELADRVVNSRSRLTHTVRRLEERGWVTREDCPLDRRGIWCVLLPEGRAVLQAAAPGHVDAVRSIIFDALDRADRADRPDRADRGELEGLGAAMRTIRAGLRASQSPGRPHSETLATLTP
jgi:DNA-binding MarR family transcriptional regulator